jgi:hypothetical protein
MMQQQQNCARLTARKQGCMRKGERCALGKTTDGLAGRQVK